MGPELEEPTPFERYADDAVVHCKSESQARYVLDRIARRLAEVGLDLNREKTHIVYCKDSDREGSCERERFDFLGYTFRPRLAKSRYGHYFVSFLPAVGDDARREIGSVIRSWHLSRRGERNLSDLARIMNPTVQGWINYYGRFYRSRVVEFLKHLNDLLVRWAMRKYEGLHRRPVRAVRWLATIYRRSPALFAHWQAGARPGGWTVGAG